MAEHVCKECGAGMSCVQAWARVTALESSLAAALAQSEGDRELLTETRAALGAAMKERDAALARAEEAEKGLDAVGHALGICYDHDQGCGGHGPVEEMVRASKEGNAASGEAIEATARAQAAEQSLAAMRRRIEEQTTKAETEALAFAEVARGSSSPQARDAALNLAADRSRTVTLLRALLAAPAPAPEEPRDYAPCHGCRKYQGRRAEACDARVHRVAPGEACEHLQPIAAHPADCACRAASVDQAPETGPETAQERDPLDLCDSCRHLRCGHGDDGACSEPISNHYCGCRGFVEPAPAAPTRAPNAASEE